jgi:hypothetical protein
MKKLMIIVVAFVSVIFMTSLIIDPASTKSTLKNGTGGKSISDEVMKIAKKSCVNCHTEPGNKMALMHVNMSTWDKYSPEKQAEKAKEMCNMVTKGKMPPKHFTKKHPEGVPSKEEIKTICNWAQ